jgi:DNA-binding MarR family transcriptional regulator/GNAT superfamily N-acetyltransferase
VGVDQAVIAQVRSSSRTMVRELGFMQATIAATNYSASAVHALIEIESGGESTAASLVNVLGLEKSSVSRMVSKLIVAGELKEVAGKRDGRVKRLLLTRKGRKTVSRIHQYGQAQVAAALNRLDHSQQATVVRGLADYAGALALGRQGAAARPAASMVQVSSGYRPGVIGRIVQMHADYYSKHHGFGQFFEGRVAAGVAAFVGRLDQPRNQLWTAIKDGRIVGSVAIDGQDLGDGQAHLRWFILDDGCRGSGVGRELLGQALEFCDRLGFASTQLWTFEGLEAARRLYEKHGFALAREWQGTQWGSELMEQQFTRPMPPAA